MKRSLRPGCVLGILVFLTACSTGFGDIVYTSGPSDGLAIRDWSSGVFAAVDRNDPMPYAYHDSLLTHWEMPIFQFPISSLHGMIDAQATMHLFNNGGAGAVTPRYYGEGNGIIRYEQATAGTSVGAFDASTYGWVDFDVSEEVQDAIDNGYPWVVFNFHIPAYTYVTFSAAEDTDWEPWLEVIDLFPEPATLGLMAFGLLPLLRRRKRSV